LRSLSETTSILGFWPDSGRFPSCADRDGATLGP
jgi:hypothetical protein